MERLDWTGYDLDRVERGTVTICNGVEVTKLRDGWYQAEIPKEQECAWGRTPAVALDNLFNWLAA